MRVTVRVIPRAPKNQVGGVRDGKLLVRVTAPPVDSAANDAVVALLAAHFGLPKRAVRIVSGERSRNKIVDIDGAVPQD
jgi:uncharacterized protein (TIGR00251 family)